MCLMIGINLASVSTTKHIPKQLSSAKASSEKPGQEEDEHYNKDKAEYMIFGFAWRIEFPFQHPSQYYGWIFPRSLQGLIEVNQSAGRITLLTQITIWCASNPENLQQEYEGSYRRVFPFDARLSKSRRTNGFRCLPTSPRLLPACSGLVVRFARTKMSLNWE